MPLSHARFTAHADQLADSSSRMDRWHAPTDDESSLHDRCPGSCCRGSCPGAVLRSASRWAVPLALLGCAAAFATAQTVRTAIVWVGLQITLEGELSRAPALNTSFWTSVSDGWDDGFWLSQGTIAFFSGILPYLCVLGLLLLWFMPRNLRSWITAMVLCTKWNVWYLVFAFLQALAFQYRVVITLLPGSPLEFLTFLDVDIQASDGAYLVAFGSIAIQIIGNVAFIADAWLGSHRLVPSATDAHTDKWGRPTTRDECYPLFLTIFWRTARSAEYKCACPRVLTMLWAAACQLVVAALLVCGVTLTTIALVDDLFTTRQQTGIDLQIVLRNPNRTEALLPLTFAVANGSLAGPGVELETYEVIGQWILSAMFFGIFVVAPLLLFVLLAVTWTVPLTSRWREATLTTAIVCQSWFAIPLTITPTHNAIGTNSSSDYLQCLMRISVCFSCRRVVCAQELSRLIRAGVGRRGL